MKLASAFAPAAVLVTVMLVSTGARAADDTLFGFAVDAYGAPTCDRSPLPRRAARSGSRRS